MKRCYAEQVNKMLQDYHFNIENNPQGRESHYGVLASGIQYLYGAAFCMNDNETIDDLRPTVYAIMDGAVPAPVEIDHMQPGL